MADSSRFFGRGDMFGFIRQQLFAERRNHAPALIGQRGVGKTSILLQLPTHLDARTLTTYIDLSQVRFDEPGGLLAVMADGAREALDTAGISTFRLPPVPDEAPPEGFEQWFGETYLETVLSALRRARQLVFLFDETASLFDALDNGLVPADLPDFLSQLLARDDRLKMLFTLDLADEARAERFTPLADPLLHVRVPYLPPADSEALIRQPSEPFYVVNDDAASAIMTLTGGYPYALHVANQLIFELSASRDHSESVTVADVRVILPQAIAAMDGLYRPVWDRATISEQQIMAGLAVLSENSGGRAVPLVDLRAWLRREADVALDSDNNSLTAVLRRLEYRDILRATPGYGYAFTTGLQQQWLYLYGRLPVLSYSAPSPTSSVPRKRQSIVPTIIILALIGIIGIGLIIGISHLTGNSASGAAQGTPTVTLGVDLLATRYAIDATHTQEAMPTATNTNTATATFTATVTASATDTASATNTATATSTASSTATLTATASPTLTVTPSATNTITATPDPTATASITPSLTATAVRSPTPRPTVTPSQTATLTATSTATLTATGTPSSTSSPTLNRSNSPLPSATAAAANATNTAGPPVTIGVQPTHRLPTASP
jgi:hypothetical protein